MNLILVGFMGAGKSTIAGLLKEKTGWPLYELDEEIVRADGRSIPDIFREEGEEGFRKLETRALAQALSGENGIISGGGGVVLKEENRRMMKEKGLCVRLSVSPETVLQRIGGDPNRPNLKGRTTADSIRELMEKREPFYQAAAALTVDTEGKTPEQIAEEILEGVCL